MRLKPFIPVTIIFSILGITIAGLACTQEPDLSGTWRGALETGGGAAAFNFVIKGSPGDFSGYVINSSDTLEFSAVDRKGDSLVLAFDFYDARLEAELSPDERSLTGEWIRKDSGGSQNHLPFTAEKGIASRYPASETDHDRFDGEWAVTFVNEKGEISPATGIFYSEPDGRITGTFARETGDYRFLEGFYTDSSLTLSSYTGARAYLFEAELNADGSLEGEFWSRDNEYFTWTAVRGASELRDPLNTKARSAIGNKVSFYFPDTEGNMTSSEDPAFADKPMVVYLYGTWCPNCSDESALLKEYMKNEFSNSELQIVGLAFEYTGDFDEDAAMVKKYRERFDIPWPLLVAGSDNKEEAARNLSFADEVYSYPTTYFINSDHVIEAVHVGFNGPATGPYYFQEKVRFRDNIQKILR